MVASLIEAYGGVTTLIQQSDPLPKFYQAWFMIIREEVGFVK